MAQLVLPSNQSPPAATAVILRYSAPQDNGLPFRGPSNAGWSAVWRVLYRQHTGYYVNFWYGPYSSFLWDGGAPGTYVGCHPYPETGGSAGTVHNWEIAIDGGDTQVTLGGAVKQVVKDKWFTQGMRLWVNGDSTVTVRFYTELPSTANSDIIEDTVGTTYGTTYSADHAISLFDSGWSAGNERQNGIYDAIKIFPLDIGETALLAEGAEIKRKATTNSIWWGKSNFRGPDDGLCDYGTGRRFTYVNDQRPGVLYGNEPAPYQAIRRSQSKGRATALRYDGKRI